MAFVARGKDWASRGRSPMAGQSKQFRQFHAIVVGTIGTGWAWFTVVVVVLVIVGSFAKASGWFDVAGGSTRGTVFAARGTIGFGRFANFIQIRIHVTFFAGCLTAEILVLARGTG